MIKCITKFEVCNNISMILTIITRSLIIYFIVLILLRIMGKRQIGEMQPFELVITLIIADLATIPMGETALPLLHGIIPLLTLSVLHYFLSFLSRKSNILRRAINGKPVIVIGPNGVDYKALKSLNMNFNDLQESIRTDGYFNLEEILYAIVQTNGSISILPRAPYAPLTAKDMKINKESASLPIIIFAEGKFQKENMGLAKLSEDFIKQHLKNIGFEQLKEVLLITINQSGKLYVQPRQGNFVTKQTNYNGEENW
jgi:uncharacterized membrane protein YcaP (DUF421 family)